jgi:AraC-like DNA-binding protein
LEINFLCEGEMTVLVGGRLLKVTSGRLGVFWAATPHQIVFVRGQPRFYWFTLPMAWVMQWSLPGALLNQLLQGAWLSDKAGSLLNAAKCECWLTDLREGRNRAAALEMEAALWRLGDQQPEEARSFRTVALPSQHRPVQRMASFIATHYTEPLRVEDVTACAGLHPNYAMTLFRRACGSGIMEFVVLHRLFHAKRLLMTTNLTILDIAMASGFGSTSRFYEAFQKNTGMTPTSFRRNLQSPPEASGAIHGKHRPSP